jgi:hypothetical protein
VKIRAKLEKFIPLVAGINLYRPKIAINLCLIQNPEFRLSLKADIKILFLSLIKSFQSIKASLHHSIR